MSNIMKIFIPLLSMHFVTLISAERCTYSTVYRDISILEGEDYSNYENLQLDSLIDSNWRNFRVLSKLGSGKFSDVVEGINLVDGDSAVVLKILKPIQQKIKREVKILKLLTGKKNIIQYNGLFRGLDGDSVVIVLESIGKDAQWFSHHPQNRRRSGKCIAECKYRDLSLSEIKQYMFKLLEAIDYAHSKGIMHRDIKTRNVIINRKTGELRLIDWGLADFYVPGRKYVAKVGSRYYKSPELLIGFRYYDYSVDIFSAGCILAGLLFKIEPFFKGKDNDDQLLKICDVLGTSGLHRVIRKYDIFVDERLLKLIGKRRKKEWKTYMNSENSHLVAEDGISLLEKMLVYDHQVRISAREALMDPFFDEVRHRTV